MKPGWYPLTLSAKCVPLNGGFSQPGIKIDPDGTAKLEGAVSVVVALGGGDVIAALPDGVRPINGNHIYSAMTSTGAVTDVHITANGFITSTFAFGAGAWISLENLPVNIATVVIDAIGASIVAGGVATDLLSLGWVGLANVRILEQGINGTVLNYGVSGNNTAQIRARIPALAPDKPHFVIIADGPINDLAGGLTDVISITGLKDCVGMARGLGAVPVLQTVQPVGNASWWTPAIELMRQSINNYIRTSGELVIDVDPAVGNLSNLAKPVLKAAFDSGDGTHPNNAGHQAYAGQVASIPF